MTRIDFLPVCLMFALLAALTPDRASAQNADGELVFMAIPARTGSISATGTTPAVHLRWDVTEGAFPAGLTAFELYRGATLIATLPFDQPDPLVIEALYNDADNERRLFETRALADSLGLDTSTLTTLSEALADKLASDSFFAHEASRIDPTLAAARGLAYVDRNATGTVTYRLDGVLAATQSLPERKVTLGQTTVATGTAWRAPSASGLRQLSADELRRCDAPEAMKAHGVLALDWTDPGTGPPERFALATALAGWDLWRSATPTNVVQLRDLANDAALQPHDENGAVLLSGLVKVNDLPILTSAEPPSMEPGYQAWAPASARWMSPWTDVEALGMRAGESYAFYLVARDLTGNYGGTTSALVTIPNLVPPPTPWNVHTTRRVALRDRAGTVTPDTMFIRWPHIDFVNFIADHPARTYCNLEDARATGELSFTDAPTCPDPNTAAPPRVSMRVRHYDVYRFDSAAEAARFSDADGDGVANADERAFVSDTAWAPTLTTPGSACDPSTVPLGATKYKVATVAASLAQPGPDGHLRMEWAGVQAAEDAGRVSWYRIAAVTDSGARSPISAPVRAVFPAYRESPKLTKDPPESCDESLTLEPCDSGALAGIDHTGDAAAVRYACGPNEWLFPLAPGTGNHADDLVSRAWGPTECGDFNGSLNSLCAGKSLTIQFLDADGKVIAEVSTPNFGDNTFCRCATLDEFCTDPPPITLPGSTEPVAYDPDKECVAVYRKIGGRLQRVDVVCDTLVTDFSDYYPDDLLGGPVCLYTAIQGPNGAITPKFPLACEDMFEDVYGAVAPELAGLTFNGSTAKVSIIPPEQVVLGFVTEIRKIDNTTRITTFVPAAGETGPLGQVEKVVDIGLRPSQGVVEEWCFRARTVLSQAGGGTITDSLSDWSPELCAPRRGPNTPEPAYIPWPMTPTPPEDAALNALYLDGDGLLVVHLAAPEMDCVNGPLTLPTCVGDPEGKSDEIDPCYFPLLPLEAQECQFGCDGLRASLAGRLGFVAYRQSRVDANSAAENFVQVSPLVSDAFCKSYREEDLPDGVGWSPLFGDALDVLADPYVAMADFTGTFNGVVGNPWSGYELFFIDRYPHIEGREYRYQFVYFDARGEITRTRTSQWVKAER